MAEIITAMIDDEELFLKETLNAILAVSFIGQTMLCVEEKNGQKVFLDSLKS